MEKTTGLANRHETTLRTFRPKAGVRGTGRPIDIEKQIFFLDFRGQR